MSPITAPVIDYRQLWQPHRQLRDDNTLKHAHVRKFVADFEAHIIAKECVKELELLFRFRLFDWLHWFQCRRRMRSAQQSVLLGIALILDFFAAYLSLCAFA